ncbi:hypothetical protein ACFY3J_33250 [Streptomyces sp. NPDC001231]|uniref:hypothetical protein n=1 Tax=Streptomyces sp. NPDC001231 TaxID=3364549 RepID=UPI0036C96EE5
MLRQGRPGAPDTWSPRPPRPVVSTWRRCGPAPLLSRLGSPGRHRRLALLLASGVSADVTGQVMVSDGGWTADGFGITATAAGR